uniref:NADH dehydrogenase subunit 11 n=1 Tax=Nitzschia dissipata TaxID=303402 RepID=UPI002028067A|nr:NADH dehydrogenase subunit 11 [Nitzschia dissipata]QYB23070.1 NADH dehydrogenase subunit 11 [Nitzschia dissipata]
MFEKSVSEEEVHWNDFFEYITESIYFLDHLNLQKHNPLSLIIAFENVSLEVVNMLYLLEQSCSNITLKKAENHNISNDFESFYQIDSSSNKSKLAMSSLGILLNTNTRYEGYVLNLNMRQRFLKGDFKLLSIGSLLDITLPVSNLGSNISVLKSIGEGTHLFCQDIKNSSFPLLISNTELFKRKDSKYLIKILKHTNIVSTLWNGLNVLSHSISSSGVSSLKSFLPISSEDFVNFFGLYFINVSLESVPNIKKLIELQLLNSVFNTNNTGYRVFIDQNNNTNNKEVIKKMETRHEIDTNYFHLPNNLFLEDNETYINTQGLVKRVTKLINFKKDSKNNWQIIRKFYANSKNLSYLNNSKDGNLLNFDCINIFNYKNYINFHFSATSSLTSLSYYLNKTNKPITRNLNTSLKETKIKIFNTKLKSWLDDFFMGNGKDSFSYNSSVMSKNSKIIRINSSNFF